MKIKFTKDTELIVVDEYNEETHNIVSESREVFKAGEAHEVDLINGETPLYCDIQFGDGSVANGVLRECFEIV